MPEELICPNCSRRIPLEDVNVSTDIALCRGCGRTHSFSLIRESGALMRRTLNDPPRHLHVEELYPGRKTIVYKRISPIVLFLIPFTALWSGISMWGLYIEPLLKGNIDWGKMLFGIPFLLGTLVLLFSIFMCLLGKWVITLENGLGTVFLGIGPIGWTRAFTYGPDSRVFLKQSGVSQNDVPMKGICIQDDKGEIVFGSNIQEAGKLYIAALIAEEARRC